MSNTLATAMSSDGNCPLKTSSPRPGTNRVSALMCTEVYCTARGESMNIECQSMRGRKHMNDEIFLLPGEAGKYFEPPLGPDRVRQLLDRGDLRGWKTESGRRLVS